jgi:excisionase family DNA binding protein
MPGDPFTELVQRAVAEGIREALKVSEFTNRRLMTVEEAGIYLSLSVREVYNMTAQGDLPPVKRWRRTMVDIRDLERWVERNKG